MPSFRFLHASDFHLERPPAELSEAPDHLVELLIDAAYRAAAKVFDAAIKHEVDFVVVAGDLVAPERSGPRGVLFLREQFARLAERKIGVYWTGGRADRVYGWPAVIRWPANVHIFQADVPQQVTVARQDRLLCEIVGQSLRSDSEIDAAQFSAVLSNAETARFNIGLAFGDFDGARLQSGRIDYWALGGEHEPTLPQDVRPLVHYPGTPQGRSPAEPGPHGCTLVDVNEQREIRTRPVLTDVVRYWSEPLTLPAASSSPVANQSPRLAAAELEGLLRERMQSLANSNPEVTLIVSFTLDGQSPLQTTRSSLPLPAIVGVLRGEFGYRSPPVWLDRVRLPPPPPMAEKWFEQENLLGDFLRAARRLGSDDEPIDLGSYLPSGQWREPLRDIVRPNEPAMMQAALYEAAGLGVGLLTAEEVQR